MCHGIEINLFLIIVPPPPKITVTWRGTDDTEWWESCKEFLPLEMSRCGECRQKATGVDNL